nr:MAG TPA: Repressor protein CI [Caudoviricetes sp.]
MSIGERMRKRRKELGYTLDYVAKIVGVSRQTVQRYEKEIISNIPSDKIEKIASALNTSPAFLMDWNEKDKPHAIKIPVLGTVVAGIPIDAVENIIGYEEITPAMAATGELFALHIKGKSMEPRICEGDIVIVRKQEDVESGDTAIVLVNGGEATVKKVKKTEDGIMLIANNMNVYSPHFYSNKEIRELPVQVIGKVVELRGKL